MGSVKEAKVFGILLGCVLLVCFIYLVNATHVTSPSSFSINQSQTLLLNITLNNTNSGQNGNVTQVNISLPSGFSFVGGSNGTSILYAAFTNTSSDLTWANSTRYMVNGSINNSYFWFSVVANSTLFGNYNISVASLNGATTSSTNVTVTVNDVTSPSLIQFISPTLSANLNLSQLSFPVNASATDNIGISTIRFYLWNSTGLVNNTNVSSSGATAYAFLNFPLPRDGRYYINATVNDTSNNQNLSSATIGVLFDTIKPAVSIVTPTNGGNYSGKVVFNATVTDGGSGVNTVYFNISNSSYSSGVLSTVQSGNGYNYTLDTSTLADGSYNVTVYANDSAGNLNNTAVVGILVENGAPVVTLVHPDNSISDTATSQTYIFSVTDLLPANCSLILDGVIANFNSSINVTGGQTSFTNSSSLGSHTWSISCIDYNGNVGNSSVRSIVIVDAGSSTPLSGGSGGGGYYVTTNANTTANSALVNGPTAGLTAPGNPNTNTNADKGSGNGQQPANNESAPLNSPQTGGNSAIIVLVILVVVIVGGAGLIIWMRKK